VTDHPLTPLVEDAVTAFWNQGLQPTYTQMLQFALRVAEIAIAQERMRQKQELQTLFDMVRRRAIERMRTMETTHPEVL
jgi:hypothetical protein